MRKDIIKRITLTLGIAVIAAVIFFAFAFWIRQASLPIAVLGAVILFILIGSFPVWFFIADKIMEKKARKSEQPEDKND